MSYFGLASLIENENNLLVGAKVAGLGHCSDLSCQRAVLCKQSESWQKKGQENRRLGNYRVKIYKSYAFGKRTRKAWGSNYQYFAHIAR